LAAAERASHARIIAVKQNTSDLEKDALVMGIAFLDPHMIPQKCQKVGQSAAPPCRSVRKVPQEDVSVCLGLLVKTPISMMPGTSTSIVPQPIVCGKTVEVVASVKKRKRVYDHANGKVVAQMPPVIDEDMGTWLAGVEVSLEGGRGIDEKMTAHSDPIFALLNRH